MKLISKSLIALAMFAGVAVSYLGVSVGTATPAAAGCNVQMGYPNSCADGYDRSCARLGRNNPWCLNGSNRYYGGGSVGGGVRYGVRGGSQVVTGGTQTVVTGRTLVYRGTVMVPRGAAVVGRGAVAGSVQANVAPADPYANLRGGPTAQGAPSPEAVYQQQLAAGAVTKVRVPCAAGFDTLPNGNCGRWVPN